MLAQDGADRVEIDLALADLQALAVEALGVAEVEMGGMRAERARPSTKSKPK